jgi:pimeloyl-ACP methyl ester carboxylesterase
VTEPLPLVLIPGLLCSPRLYAAQIPELWRAGPVMIADHTRDDSIAGIARRILAGAPGVFALAGLSMGGYIAFEMVRAAPERIARLALLDTSAWPDTAEQSAARRMQMALAAQGEFAEVVNGLFPRLVHRTRHADVDLRAAFNLMAEDVGVEGYLRQQAANLGRADSRATLAHVHCPTLVLVGDGDEVTPPERAAEMARGIAGARLVSVPQCGHLSTLERPEEVTRALLEWLRT